MITTPQEVFRRKAYMEHQTRELRCAMYDLLQIACRDNTLPVLELAGLSNKAVAAFRRSEWPTISVEKGLVALQLLGYDVTVQIDEKKLYQPIE